MNLEFVDHAIVREDHDVGMRRSDEEMLDVVAALGGSAKSSFAAASLALISRNRRSLDVTAVGDRDRHVFVGNQIFD